MEKSGLTCPSSREEANMTRPKKRSSVCIVGAGICGLVAARSLREAGREVIVLDKSRGVGGRMATRRVGDAVIDHGAQFVTAHDPEFGRLLREWVTDGVAREWTRGLSFPHGLNGNGSAAYRGEAGMTSMPKQLAERLDVRVSSRVLGIRRADRGYLVETEAGDLPGVDVLVLTAPVPQSLEMLRAGDIPIGTESLEVLASIGYDPCLTLLVVLDGPSRIPSPGALKLEGEPITFLADNRQKGISPEEHSVTIHAGSAFSRAHLDDDDDEIAEALLVAAREHLGSNVKSRSVHRWRYGVPVLRHSRPFHQLVGERIFFAGDAFGGPNVEGAALSGMAVADHIRKRF
jgi:predicted NAD/FAD-dependent oxidoreductase